MQSGIVFWNTAMLLACMFGLSLSCKSGWISYQGYCYFHSGSDTLLTWQDATYQCAVNDSILAALDDLKEQTFINESLLGNAYGPGAWLGGYDFGSEGEWMWTTREPIDIGKFKWRPGNPDDGGGPLTKEDCLLISTERTSRGELNDYRCSKKLPWICKAKDSDNIYDPTTVTTLSTTVSPTCTSCVEADRNDEVPSTPVLPIVVVTTSVVVGAILVSVMIVIRRHTRKPSEQNHYEDAQHIAQSSDHKYDSLDQSATRPATAHIYSSVYIDPESSCRPNPQRRNDETNGPNKFGSSYMDVVNPRAKNSAASNGVSLVGSSYMDVVIDTSDKQSSLATNTSNLSSNGPTSAKSTSPISNSTEFGDSGYAEVVAVEDKNPYATPYIGVQGSSESSRDMSVGSTGVDRGRPSPNKYGDAGYVEPDIKSAKSQFKDIPALKADRKGVNSKNYLAMN